jgi:cytochrome c peroxidase
MNHAGVSQVPADHPLNPNLNGLHWSWQGGYIFLALEGMWRSAEHPFDGWSYHLARDTNRMRVSLAVALDLARDTKLELDFDLAALLNAPRPLSFGKDGSSTHSREGDPIAAALVANLPGSFRVQGVSALGSSETAAAQIKPLHLPENFTPYRFRMSATFPIPELPRDNPLTEEGVRLGALLFFDPRLSANNSQSCARCHQPEAAFVDLGKAVSRGAEGDTGTRNSMPLFNLAWKSSFFWDGRAASLREQVLQPIQNPIEMHETLENVVARLKSSRVNSRHETRAFQSLVHNRPSEATQSLFTSAAANRKDYPALFAGAFGTPEITTNRIARALEQFLLAQVSHESKFDRFIAGKAELTPEEQRGFELFRTEYDPRRGQFGADCFHCHGGPLFQSQSFANNGLDAEFKDLGRYLATKKDGDKGKFAVPSLRNVAVTAPYMHDGRFATLEEVVEHYGTGVKRSATLDPNLAKHPNGGVPLSVADKHALAAFLRTLTDERFRRHASAAVAEADVKKP